MSINFLQQHNIFKGIFAQSASSPSSFPELRKDGNVERSQREKSDDKIKK